MFVVKEFFLFNIILILLVSLTSCSSYEHEMSYYEFVDKNDVYVEKNSNSLYIAFTVRPQIDIDHLTLAFGFYDKNDYPVVYASKRLGKVIAGQEYHIEFSFSTKEMLAISKYKYLDADGEIYKKCTYSGICEHTYNDGYVQKKASCANNGMLIKECTKCGLIDTNYIPYEEHNWVTNKYSDTKYICTKCCIRSDSKDN